MDFGKYTHTKFQQADIWTDRQAEMMKLTDAFHSSVNVLNKQVKDHLVQV